MSEIPQPYERPITVEISIQPSLWQRCTLIANKQDLSAEEMAVHLFALGVAMASFLELDKTKRGDI